MNLRAAYLHVLADALNFGAGYRGSPSGKPLTVGCGLTPPWKSSAA